MVPEIVNTLDELLAQLWLPPKAMGAEMVTAAPAADGHTRLQANVSDPPMDTGLLRPGSSRCERRNSGPAWCSDRGGRGAERTSPWPRARRGPRRRPHPASCRAVSSAVVPPPIRRVQSRGKQRISDTATRATELPSRIAQRGDLHVPRRHGRELDLLIHQFCSASVCDAMLVQSVPLLENSSFTLLMRFCLPSAAVYALLT